MRLLHHIRVKGSTSSFLSDLIPTSGYVGPEKIDLGRRYGDLLVAQASGAEPCGFSFSFKTRVAALPRIWVALWMLNQRSLHLRYTPSWPATRRWQWPRRREE
jgi:hypothetical protein